MAVEQTTSLELGFKAPDFKLFDVVSEQELDLSSVRGERATVVMFICNHCPYVIHVRKELVQIALDYRERGVGFVAINSNDVEKYPEDSPEKMKEMAKEHSFPFPYLFDETQEVAKAYSAACTPDFSVFDAELTCVYRGRLDESRPGNDKPLNGLDLRRAIDAVLNKEPITWKQEPSMGCSIKWKPDNK